MLLHPMITLEEWHENEELKARVFGAEKRMFLWPGDAKGKKKQVTSLAVKLNKVSYINSFPGLYLVNVVVVEAL